MRRLMWVGDAAVDSGFARATEHTVAALVKDWNVHVLGINYRGDPHPFRTMLEKAGGQIYPAYVPGGDLFGVARIIPKCQEIQPDVVVLQNDPWNIPRYLERLRAFKDYNPTVIGALAVDGKNLRGEEYLNGLDHAIFWTQFALDEARAGGFTKPADVVPLGVDLNIYHPGDRQAARTAIGWPEEIPRDAFVFVNVNRNQPRKRLDLTLEYFAEFYHSCKADNAYLYLHVAPTGDTGYDCSQLTKYYGLRGHVIMVDPGAFQGATETELANTYRACDALITTSQGEGWGLTTLEAMACGLSCVFGDWAALGDWAKPGGIAVPCDHHAVTPNGRCNVVGAIPAKNDFVRALELLYNSQAAREYYSKKALEVAQHPRYRWENIGKSFADVVARAYDSCALGV